MRLKTSSTYQLTRLAAILTLGATLLAAFGIAAKESTGSTWSQWRGPSRDGKVGGPVWPETINDQSLTAGWRVPVGPSYSGPIVSADHVFVTETSDKTTEIVRALDRRTGREVWSQSWPGAISVPFYAKSRGDWIRSTPAFDGKFLYVAGMRDVLVALDAKTGKERWRVDFASKFSTNAPDFGLICSPLIDGEFIYIQASNSTIKLRKATGEIVWRAFEGRYGVMSEGAFSSPVMATIQGRRQLVVQSREVLAGLDLESGAQLWSTPVASFRGMNILTPVVFGDSIFTSSYQNKSWRYDVTRADSGLKVAEAWSNNASGYMSTPVIIDGYAYLHLGNQRFTCIDLRTGERTWTSTPFGKYVSLVAQGDRILGLDERGILLLIRANPKEFQLIEQRQVSEDETWAHLAVVDNEIFIRELRAVSQLRWQAPKRVPAGAGR
ncbi:MAG: pyrrolo-quinoline quinone [Acidobacteria bacterium]|nr:pyrrolo-quinoline quinone [Acidobacteriota bacterium]